MPANRFNGYTDYKVGIGLRSPRYDHILSKKPAVDRFETFGSALRQDWPTVGIQLTYSLVYCA